MSKRKNSGSPGSLGKKAKMAVESSNILYANKCSANEEEKSRWPRPVINPPNPKVEPLIFQQMDCNYSIQQPDSKFSRTVGSKEKSVPIIRMFGLTESGASVLLIIHGVLPYIYVPVPIPQKQLQNIPDLCNKFRISLDSAMRSKFQSRGGTEQVSTYVQMVEIHYKQSIMRYRGADKDPFFKVVFSIPGHVPTARSILEEGLTIPGLGQTSFNTFESNIPFVLRFMVDHGIVGGGWIELPAKKYELASNTVGVTQIEAECVYEDLIAHPADSEEYSKVAPLRVLSFDIECAAPAGSFPDPSANPVIQIANYVTVHGQDDKPITKNVFVLGKSSPIVDADVRCYETEKEMLLSWREFVIKSDPDILTGYNIVNFDIPYLLDRAKKLKLDEFSNLTRLAHQKVSIKDATFSSNQTGTRESKEINLHGRVVFDMIQVIQSNHKLSSYTLNSVSSHFLGQQKEDVHHSIISKLFSGTNDDRRRLAAYCLKDAYLPLRLMNTLMSLINYVEMARVTGVPFSFLLLRGQGIKVMSQLLRKTKTEDIVIPTIAPSKTDMSYEGAQVIDPMTGFYEKPIATLDFSSLYPSIMMAHNLCYTTLVTPTEVKKLSEDSYEVTPSGNHFVKNHVRKGILPQILESLLSARQKAKKLLSSETDPIKKNVYNGRQLALKISANSVYGFTGQTVGQLPCIEISASVTAYGRDMLLFTKEVVTTEYTLKNGYKADAQVIYGDTDSVMVNFGVDTLEEAIKLGKDAAKFVSSKFPSPISLEFEKCYYPFLLIAKKRYAGLWWTKPDKWDKLDAKGIESVRRDNCALVRHVVDTSLRKILINRDIGGAIDFVKNTIRELLQNKTDLSLLIITKSLTKTVEDYTAPQAHTHLAMRMKERDPASAPNIGDRIPYVIIRGDKDSKTYEKAEDPLYVLNNDIAIDAQYYLENQLTKPLCRIYQALMDNPKATLLSGDHTRQISIPTPKERKGILQFTQVRETCMNCKAPLRATEKILCNYCKENSPDVYCNYLSKLRIKEQEFSRLWTQCQSCQGSMHQEVLCTARDCPIFYLRAKVRKELEDTRKTLRKFDDLSW